MNGTGPRLVGRSSSWISDLHHEAGDTSSGSGDSDKLLAGPLLLVECSRNGRAFLQRALTARGIVVTGVSSLAQAEAATADANFAFAVIDLRLRDGDCLPFVQGLRQRCTKMRIVVVTDADSFASVIRTLGAGADDYKPQPVDEDELVDALLDRATTLPAIPEMPLGLSRTCWEHIMRIYEQCDRNVSRTAQRLGMHRRSLQRVLSKRAPLPRVR
jgi:two-component system, response regulator RegA